MALLDEDLQKEYSKGNVFSYFVVLKKARCLDNLDLLHLELKDMILYVDFVLLFLLLDLKKFYKISLVS